jgi:hypothetical protein
MSFNKILSLGIQPNNHIKHVRDKFALLMHMVVGSIWNSGFIKTQRISRMKRVSRRLSPIFHSLFSLWVGSCNVSRLGCLSPFSKGAYAKSHTVLQPWHVTLKGKAVLSFQHCICHISDLFFWNWHLIFNSAQIQHILTSFIGWSQ